MLLAEAAAVSPGSATAPTSLPTCFSSAAADKLRLCAPLLTRATAYAERPVDLLFASSMTCCGLKAEPPLATLNDTCPRTHGLLRIRHTTPPSNLAYTVIASMSRELTSRLPPAGTSGLARTAFGGTAVRVETASPFASFTTTLTFESSICPALQRCVQHWRSATCQQRVAATQRNAAHRSATQLSCRALRYITCFAALRPPFAASMK
jgi:hypothetical protein